MRRSVEVVTEDIICELNLSPRVVPRTVEQVEKSTSNSRKIFFEYRLPVMKEEDELTGEEYQDNHRPINLSSDLFKSLEIKSNTSEDNVYKATSVKIMEANITGTEFSSMLDFNKKTLSKVSATDEHLFSSFPARVLNTSIEGQTTTEKLSVKEKTLPKSLPRPRVLEMTPFNLSTEYDRSPDGSPSSEYGSARSPGSPYEVPLKPLRRFNSASTEDLVYSGKERSLRKTVSSVEYKDLLNQNGFEVQSKRTVSSEFEFKHSSPPSLSPDSMNLLDNFTFNDSRLYIDALSSEKIETTESASPEREPKPFKEIEGIFPEKDDITDGWKGRSSVTIVEVQEEQCSPLVNESVVGTICETNNPVITEYFDEKYPLKTSSVSIIEVENEEKLSLENNNSDLQINVDLIKTNNPSNAPDDLNEAPIPRPRNGKQETDLDENFVEWLQDHGFKVVDEATAIADEDSSDKKKRLSWEFILDDDVENDESDEDQESPNFQEQCPTLDKAAEPVYVKNSYEEETNELVKLNSTQPICEDYSLRGVSTDNNNLVRLKSLDDEATQIIASVMDVDKSPEIPQYDFFENHSMEDQKERESMSLPSMNDFDITNYKTSSLDIDKSRTNFFDNILNNSEVVTTNKYVESDSSDEECVNPLFRMPESEVRFQQKSASMPPTGSNAYNDYELGDVPGSSNKPHGEFYISDDAKSQSDIEKDRVKPSFILDAYNNDDSISERCDVDIISATMEKYPDASLLILQSGNAEDFREPYEDRNVVESGVQSDLIDSSENMQSILHETTNAIDIGEFYEKVSENDIRPSSESDIAVRKKWNFNDARQLDVSTDDNEVFEVLSVDTLRRKIEEARKSSYSVTSERSFKEKEASAAKTSVEDVVFLAKNSDMNRFVENADEIQSQHEIVPAPPPRPSLSSEHLDKEPDIYATVKKYLKTNLDMSSIVDERNASHNSRNTQSSYLGQGGLESTKELTYRKMEVVSNIVVDSSQPRESAVDVPEETLCTCPRISSSSLAEALELEDVNIGPQYNVNDENMANTHTKSHISTRDQEEIHTNQPRPASSLPQENTRQVPPSNTFGPDRTTLECPYCKKTVTTATIKKPSLAYGCCVVPIFVDSMKDVEHWCPECQCFLGKYSWKPFKKNV